LIHRAIFGSLERFFAIMVENYAGDFPVSGWHLSRSAAAFQRWALEVCTICRAKAAGRWRALQASIASGGNGSASYPPGQQQKIPLLTR